jgi:hypothetical protein
MVEENPPSAASIDGMIRVDGIEGANAWDEVDEDE